jgi:hypothetical protein
MVMVSPFANSVRATPVQASAQGLGSIAQLLQQLKSTRPEAGARVPQEQPQLFTADVRQEPTQQIPMEASEALAALQVRNQGPDITRLPVASIDFGPKFLGRPAQAVAEPANPFEGNEQYQALMDFQKSLAPSAEQQARLQELQSAFEGTGAYKDYRIQQMEQQMQQMQQRYRQPRSPMGMGLGMANPYGMRPYTGFGRPQFPMQQPMRQPMPMPRGGYNQYQNQFGGMMGMQQQPYQQQQYGMMGGYQQNPYQQMRPQPQQFGGYGMGQQMGGYGSFGGMPNPYQPQQMGYNQNNYSGYAGMQNFAALG